MKHFAVTMVMLLCSIAASAHDFEVDGIYYNITSSTNLTVEVTYKGDYYYSYDEEYSGELEIPTAVFYNGQTYSVLSIGNRAFEECNTLTSVCLPSSVTNVGHYAFEHCSGLTSITLSEGVVTIGSYAFRGCKEINNINLPTSIESIGNYAFRGCIGLSCIVIPKNVTVIRGYTFYACSNLTSVSIPSNVAVIEESAFEDCNALAEIVLPASVASVGDYAFYGCSNLISITCEAENPPTLQGNQVFGGIPSTAVLYIPQSSLTAYKDAGWGGSFSSIEAIMPSGTCGDNLTWKLTDNGELVIEGVGKMMGYASASLVPWFDFAESVKSVVISDGVTEIGDRAFQNCSNLVTIDIPESMCRIGQDVLDGTAWYNNQSDGVVYIDNWLYGYKGEMPEDFDLSIKEGTKGIVDYAFEECVNLIVVTISESVLYIGDAAFISSGLVYASIPEGVISIGGGVFFGCSNLDNIAIPESVTKVGNETFTGTAWYKDQPCGILRLSDWVLGVKNCGDCENCTKMDYSNICILSGVKGVAEGFFYGDYSSITIPESVIYLQRAFTNGSVSSIVCTALVPPSGVDENTFGRVKDTAILYVPASAIDAYKADKYWGEIANIKAIDFPVWTLTVDGELIIDGEGAMDNYMSECTPWSVYDAIIRDVIINEGITSVGNNAFAYCEELKSVSLPNSLVLIGEGAFAECSKLKSIVIPENVETLASGAFYGCGLSSITSKAVTPPVVADQFTFQNVNKSIPIYVPQGSVTAYETTDCWSDFANIQAMPVTITINQYGSATYSSEYALDFSEVNGLKAYAATGYNPSTGVVTLTRVMTAKAGIGLFLKGEPGEYTVPVLESTDDNSLNMLVGTLRSTAVNSTSSDGLYYNYRYTIKDGDEAPLFYRIDDGYTLGAGKAYLQIPVVWMPAEAKSISLRFDDGGTTDIDEMESEVTEPVYYDLMGRKVVEPQKGNMYIVNGKKIIFSN